VHDVKTGEQSRLSGRRGQAARNDERILAAAREVFIADADAPIAAVAARAGVGISALYRRWSSKEDLLRRLCRDGLRRYNEEAEAAVSDEGDAWEAFATFMRRIVDEDVHSLTVQLAGSFTPTEDMYADAQHATDLNERLVSRTKALGGLRSDVAPEDLALILEQLAAIRPGVFGDERRTRRLRHRYLALSLDGLRSPIARLPGPPPSQDELGRRWTPRTASPVLPPPAVDGQVVDSP
jgi:AcrR family transcriptional regulator